MIDLRSDTATRPTEGMRAAIAAAEVGDEQKREDPTVNALQERAAALLGQEAALFVPTATMANQIALKLHTRPGDVLVAERHAHVVIYEYGGAAAHAGLLVEPIAGRAGRFGVAELEAASMPSTKAADQRATLVALENTHNSSGGRCWPLPELRAVTRRARERGLATHLDGARLLNAAVATGVPPAELGGPVRHRHALPLQGSRLSVGGAARGIGGDDGARVAREAPLRWRDAAGRDRRGRRRLRPRPPPRAAGRRPRTCPPARRGLARGRPARRPRAGRDEFRPARSRGLGFDRDHALALLRDAGVGLSSTIHPTVARAVTHLDVDDDDIERAIELAPGALLSRAAA